jgi:S1-C subfamily serine protease
VDQSTPDFVPDERALDGVEPGVPAVVAWALNHDLPGASTEPAATRAEHDPHWTASFTMPPPPESPKRDWRPLALTAAAAVAVTLLVLWLLGLLGGGSDGTTDADGDVVEMREIVSDAGGSTSAATVGSKVTPSVVTVEVGDSAADGIFRQTGLGSGVVLTSNGYIVTNHHVIDEAARIRIVIQDGTTYEGELVGSDARTDLAVIRIDATDLTPIDLGQTDTLSIGDTAIAVGNPLGLEGGASLTLGVLSAFEREVSTADSGTLFGMLQTDAPITRGSSGGALVDSEGRLIGITTAIGVSSAGAEGIGFAVPVEVVDRIAEELIETGDVRHAFLGVRLENFFEEVDGATSRPAGARVSDFPEGVESAAAGAGLRIDDVIIAANGDTVTTRDDLISILRRFRVGESVSLLVMRDGESLTFNVELGERPDDL